MKTYLDYSESFSVGCNTEMLDFCTRELEFCIYDGSRPLVTPGGNYFEHPSEDLIRLLVTDLHLHRGSAAAELSSPILFSFRKDILEHEEDPFMANWAQLVSEDPFVAIKTSGASSVQPFNPDDPLFTFAFVSLTGLIAVVGNFTARAMSEISLEANEHQPFQGLLKHVYSRLPADQKVAVQALSGVHRSGIVLPLLLVTGEISAVTYVKGLISLKIQDEGAFQRILTDVARVQDYLGVLLQQHGPERPVSALISEGEGDLIEFKSTLRWDIRAGKTNPAIERACLKTISAFLNSKGGALLIGVRDDGSVEGIETDRFANEDKFLLHLWTLIRICLGMDFSPFIRTRIRKLDGKAVCIVDCAPANRPVFLRQPGFDEEMFIRVGPSSNAMDISQALTYIRDHFPAG